MNSEKIKVNFIVDNISIAYWKIKSIKKLLNNDQLEVCIYVITNISDIKDLNKKDKLFSALYKAILFLESKIFKLKLKIFSKFSLYDFEDFQNIIKDINIVDFNNYSSQNNSDLNINFTELSDIDFSRIFKINNVWSILTGNSRFNNDFKGLQEVVKQHNTFKISIVDNVNSQSGEICVLQSSHSRIDKVYVLNTLSFAFAKVPNMLDKSIKDYLCTNTKTKNSFNSILRTNHYVFAFFFGFLFNYAKKLMNKVIGTFFYDQWILMFQLEKDAKTKSDFKFDSFKEILPPKDRIWADPFFIEKNGEYHIYIEELLVKEGKGFISHFTIGNDGNYTKPQKIIEEDYHMSYPYLFEDSGSLYMIPETNNNRTISLYRCVEFPLKWEFEMHLLEDIDANDSSIIYKDNKYWIFTNVRTNNYMSCDDELHIYYSENLLSKSWVPHIQNSVVSDVRFSRPAGQFFLHEGNLIRPAQNCSKHYGYGLNFQRVDKISPNEYSELEYEKVIPDWNIRIKSVHTFNKMNRLTIIDAQKKRSR